MMMGVLSLAFLVLMGVTSAWSTHGMMSRKAYPYPWAPARRSAFDSCSYTGQPCQTTSQCCSQNDVCLTSVKYGSAGNKGLISTCQDMKLEMKYAKYAGRPLKASGHLCKDSSECADLCCREVRGHRARYHVCGSPEDEFMAYTCVKAARSGNDVLDDLI